jgi:hypothetical protein
MANDSPPPQPPSLELIIQPSELAGVWANWAQVTHSEHEFTIDFARLDPIQPGRGIVVARVALSPLMIDQLREALRQNWEKYAEKAMPKEVRDAGSTTEDEPDRPEGQEPGT